METFVENVVNQPERFIEPSAELRAEIEPAVSTLFEVAHASFALDGDGSQRGKGRRSRKSQNKNKGKKDIVFPIETLLTSGFDGEQIWEQIELYNNAVFPTLKKACKAKHTDITLFESSKKTSKAASQASGRKNSGDEEQEEQEEDEDEQMGLEDEGESGAEEDAEDGIQGMDGLEGSQEEEKEEEEEAEDGEVPSSSKGKKSRKGDKSDAPQTAGRKGKGSVVDDEFFKLSEMQAFLKAQEKRDAKAASSKGADEGSEEEDEDEEEIDMFGDGGSEDEGEEDVADMTYSKFFGGSGAAEEEGEDGEEEGEEGEEEDSEEEGEENAGEASEDEDGFPSHKKSRGLLDGDGSEEEEGEEGVKSKYEREQERIKKQIQQLESFNVSEKPWQLQGEIKSDKRPQNSLLEENLDFEQLSAPAPEITQETTQSLEEMIKRRIRDHLFDDVERKIKGKDTPFVPKRTLADLDQEKSKEGLGDIYAKEYLAKTESGPSEAEKKLEAKHNEINQLFAILDVKLNELSNFHYTPKPPSEDVVVVSNVPSIKMENVAPVAMSTASMLAPEEIMRKNKQETMAQEEKTETDKKRERRRKKKVKHVERVEKEIKDRETEKQNPNAGMSKTAALEKLKKGGNTTIIRDDGSKKGKLTSTSFFKQLQENAQADISKGKEKKSDKKKEGSSVSVAALKL